MNNQQREPHYGVAAVAADVNPQKEVYGIMEF
jgi:hypothetical protein